MIIGAGAGAVVIGWYVATSLTPSSVASIKKLRAEIYSTGAVRVPGTRAGTVATE